MGRLYLTIAFILAGSSVIAASFISAYLPTFTTTFLSLVFASLTAVLFCGKNMYDTAKSLSRKTWTVILLQAMFGSFLFRVFLTTGLQYIGAAEAGIITGATPAITALLTWLMLHEYLSLRTVTGVLIAFAGVLLVQGFPFETAFENFQPIGAIYVLCAAVCESLFTTFSRKIHMYAKGDEILPPLVHAGLVSICAMVLCLIPALLEQPWAAIAALPVSGWIAFVWYGSIVTIVAFAFMFAGAKRCNGYTIAAFAGIIPISSTLFSVTILKESISKYQAAGCVLVVFATLIISSQKKAA
ncbi:DMT family transporter [Lacrimispora sp.]|uniref:DMT family transporter n=1 Tax=Lacrimispora sp. TaxID=2719234 RepID=UPI00289F7C47|nr:DMT family transporter [Lacrimispora sp.]